MKPLEKSLEKSFEAVRDWTKGQVERVKKSMYVPDNSTIVADQNNKMEVPALVRVFRAHIELVNASSADLYPSIEGHLLKEGDLLFCDINTYRANYNCRPTTFTIIWPDGNSITRAALSTCNLITGDNNTKKGYTTVPYLSYYTSGNDHHYDNGTGFTILRFRGIYNSVYQFQDLLDSYVSYTTSYNGNSTALATQIAVKKAYDDACNNALYNHANGTFQIANGDTIELPLYYPGGSMVGEVQYLIAIRTRHVTTGVFFGSTAKLVSVPSLNQSGVAAGNVNIVDLGHTANTGYTLTAGVEKLTIKAAANYQVFGSAYGLIVGN